MTDDQPTAALGSAAESSNWVLIKRLLALSWRYRQACVHVLVLQLLLLLLGLAGIGFAGLGIDVVRHAADPAAPQPRWPFHLVPSPSWPPMEVVSAIAALVIVFALLRCWLNYLNLVRLNELVQGRIVVDLRSQVFDKLQRLGFRFFDANASASLINRVTADTQSVRMFVDQVLIQAIIMAISLAAYAVFMVAIHPGLTLACLASTPLIWFLSGEFSRVVQPAYKVSRDLLDRLVQRFAESIRGVQVIKAFAGEEHEIARFNEANDIVRDQQQWIFWRVSLFTPLMQFMGQFNLVVLLGYGGYLAAKGQLPIGAGLVAFAAILQQFAGQVANIATITNSMQQSLRGARRVFEVLDTPLEIVSPEAPAIVTQIHGRVRFENVWFDHGRDPVLQDLDFEVQAGQRVAIVGPTGAGKSALMSLIPRFYDPTSGRVTLDGIDLRQYRLEELRRSVGLVFQESFLFSTSIADNIAFGAPDASREQIIRAARIAAADGFISEMPAGYDTKLGSGGVGLSGGQKQRLAIARAVLLDPPILLLDDPTAAVDPGTEHEIVTAMSSAMANRTTFLVTHRASALQRADLVIVLQRGRIVQIGTHAQLMKSAGYYAESFLLHAPEGGANP